MLSKCSLMREAGFPFVLVEIIYSAVNTHPNVISYCSYLNSCQSKPWLDIWLDTMQQLNSIHKNPRKTHIKRNSLTAWQPKWRTRTNSTLLKNTTYLFSYNTTMFVYHIIVELFLIKRWFSNAATPCIFTSHLFNL